MYLPRDYDKEEFERIKQLLPRSVRILTFWWSPASAAAIWRTCRHRGRQGDVPQRAGQRPEDLLLRQQHQPTYLNDIIALCKGKRFSINVISKSGTTTETSLAFRVLRRLLEDEMGVEEANKRIYATTDRAKGTLKQLADAQGWPTFVVPDDVGGRYSVLSAVGLLPIAAAGISIDDVMKGAATRWSASPCSAPTTTLQVCGHPQHPVPQGQEHRDPRVL